MLYHVFVDLEKAFGRVPREVIAWVLTRTAPLTALSRRVYV